MSAGGRTPIRPGRKKAVRKPPPRWRKYLTQAELELPPPAVGEDVATPAANGSLEFDDEFVPAWWQSPVFVAALGAACVGLVVVAGTSLLNAARDREAAQQAEARARVLTLRAINSVRALRITANPRSWSTAPDATIAWPEPPQMLELHLPVGYTEFLTFAVIVDKVDHGRVLVVERIAPDSNHELLLSLNSSAFGPGEYRLRLQGYTWRGNRVDVGWVRLVVAAPAS
jgi:hypothetical protein